MELDPSELEALVRREPEALGRFFDVWFDRVYAYVRRMVADEHLAEDLTQDVFMHVYRAIESYDPKRALRPWVFTIATNKVRDHWRSRRHAETRAEASVERDGAAAFVEAEVASPSADLDREDTDRVLKEAIDDLPEGMRVTLVLRVYEEMSFEEIGAVLDRTEVAVRKRYSRALEALRDALKGAKIHLEEA